MSSSLTTLVPVLNGPNYTSWAPMMQSFLMSQGQWKVMDPPPVPVEESPATDTKEAVYSNQEEITTWNDLNIKPLVIFASASIIPSPTTSATLKLQLSCGVLWRKIMATLGLLHITWS